MESRPNLRHLRAVSEVAALKSITAAAERVFVSQSALTQAIAKLETALGCALFHRDRAGLRPTHEGKLFLQRVNRCLYLLQQGVREAMRHGKSKQADPHPSDHPAQLITNAQIRALLALKKNPSYSAAARQVGVSQPALYRAARELENGLNLHLFNTTTHGVALTDSAQELARFCGLALREIDLGFDELSSLSGPDTTLIAIGVMPLARTNILPAAINRLTELKPELKIQVVDGSQDELLMQLLSGDIDLLMGPMIDPAPSEALVQLPLFNTTLSVVARQRHPLVSSTGLTLAALQPYRWVLPRPGSPARAYFDAVVGELNPEVYRGAVESGSQIVTREILAGSDRLSFLSSYQIRHDQKAGLLTVLDINLPAPSQTIVLTLRKEWTPIPTHLLFISIIKTLSQEETQPQN